MKRILGPCRSLLALAPLLLGAPFIAYKIHYLLPEPVESLINPITNAPHLAESQVLYYAKYLSEDIGYRTVGTKEHALGDAWFFEQVQALTEGCPKGLECEVWRQQGSGSHRFDMMNKRLYKTYVNLTNIVVRISNGTVEGKEHAVLMNSHLDSTLPSPGAADDALSVGVMMECLRVLLGTPGWSPTHSIIFLFNNAEESLQDGSHLFATQHPVASSVRAVINLEAAGTMGRELLFQATSEQMIQAYSHVPRPFGTVVANEIFSSGIILSDTDFRQFEEYLNVTGLDMAVVTNSYLYHMRKDVVENIEPGVAQHMGENALALLQYLSSPESPLPELTTGYTEPSTVFFTHMGLFFLYSYQTARLIYGVFFFSAVFFVRLGYVDPAPALKKGTSMWVEQLTGCLAVCAAPVGAIVGVNTVAILMQRVFGRGMSWFAEELSCLALYGPAALAGALASQLLFGRIREHTLFTSLVLVQAFLAIGLQLAGLGSAAIYYLSALPLALALIVNRFLVDTPDEIQLLTYGLGQLMPLLTGSQVILTALDVFVPLTGRMGSEAPGEHIIACIVAIAGSYTLPLVIPFAHRFNRKVLIRSVMLFSGIAGVAMIVFAGRSPFDEMHQKRLFVIHMENMTTQEQHLHLATADAAPGSKILTNEIASQFGMPDAAPRSVIMDDWNSDWDVIYPFSAFLSPYMVDLPVHPAYNTSLAATGAVFTVSALNDLVDEDAGTRSLTVQVYHPGIIWTSIAFDAHVLKWTLDNNPPDEYARHHIKEASFYGVDTWTLDLVIKIPDSGKRSISVNYVGIKEKAMWPAKMKEKAEGGRAMALFEDLDNWLEVNKAGTVDATLLGCVGGSVDV